MHETFVYFKLDTVLNLNSTAENYSNIASVSGGHFSHQIGDYGGMWVGSVWQSETEREAAARIETKKNKTEEATGIDGITADTHSL